jgi:hypothetical protein
MGWMGWEPDRARQMDIRDLTMAYEGRIEMFEAIFGKADKKSPGPPRAVAEPKRAPLTAKVFDALFGPAKSKKQKQK